MGLIKYRPRIKLLTPPQLRPGRTFEVTVVLTAERAVGLAHLDMELDGREECSVHSGSNYISQVARICRSTVRVAGETELPAGESRFSARFRVPEAAPPTYQGNRVRVGYLMHVRAAIPWWPDARASFEVHVGHAVSSAGASQGMPILFSSQPEGPRANEPHVEGSLSSNVVTAGNLITGAVALGNVAYTRYTGLRLALVGTERVALSGHHSVVEAHRYEVYVPVEQTAEGQPLRFRIRLPAYVPATYVDPAEEWSLTWQFECKAEIRWGRDLTLRVPVTVMPWQLDEPREPWRRAPPTVGSERVQAVWGRVAGRYGLAFDGARLFGAIAGGDLSIEREHRGRRGVYLVGRARYPNLHLNLSITPVRGLRKALAQGVRLGERAWDRAHYVVCRDPTQIEAVADQLRGVLTRLDFTHMNDREFLAECRSAGATEARLDEFVGALVASARALVELPGQVPPPALMRACAGQWRELARTLGGTLCAAHMAIEGMAAGSPARIRTNWSPTGEALSTILEVDAPLRIGEDWHGRFLGRVEPPGFMTLGARRFGALGEQPLLREVVTRAWLIEISAESLVATLPAPIRDPGPLADLLYSMVEWMRYVGGAVGPYR